METKEYFVNAEIKAMNDEDGTFEGYASTFGNIDSTGDIIEQGAFLKSLQSREPKVLWQHDMRKPVGKVMDIREDNKGLWVKVKLATATTLGKDAYEYMKADIINRLSIGFRIKEYEHDTDSELRRIKEVELFEFSLVTIPANEMATVTAVKSVPQTERELEKFLCDAGYTRKEAKAIVAKGMKGYQDVLRDAGLDTPTDVLRDADDEVKNLLSNLLKTLQGETPCQKTSKI